MQDSDLAALCRALGDEKRIAVRREGRWRHYRLLPEAIETLRQALSGLCKAPEASALSCSCGKKPC